MTEEVARRTGVACSLITTKDALTVEYLSRMKPDYVFSALVLYRPAGDS